MRSPYGACTASTHYTVDSLDEMAESIRVAQLRYSWTEASVCPHTMQGSKLPSLYPIRSSDVAPKVDPTISTLTNPLNVDQNEASASTGSERSSRPLRFRSNDDDSLHS